MSLLPKTIDNEYRGSRLAFSFFVAMAVLTITRSLVPIVAPNGGAQSIVTIPLDSFTANGAGPVVPVRHERRGNFHWYESGSLSLSWLSEPSSITRV